MFKVLRAFPVLRQPPRRSLQPSRARIFVSRRSLISQNGPVKVQHVQITRPVRFRRLLISTLQSFAYLGLATLLVAFLLVDDEEEDEEEDEVEGEGETNKEESSEGSKDGDTIFIPLGFAYKLPKTYYKGTDPEWQSFVELSKNKKLCDFLRNQLAGLVGQYIGAVPQVQAVLGGNSKPRKFWIDIDFPQGPPPEYERKGLEIGDEHISWTTRPVHPLLYSKLQKALWPESMASSVWASHKTFAGLQYTKIKNMLAFQSDPEAPGSKKSESIGLHLQKLLQQTRPQKQEHDPETDSGMPAESSSFKPTPDRRPARDGSSNIAKLLPSTPTIPDLGDDSLSIVDAFKKTFAKTWKPAYAPPERGTVIFSGMVEIVGPKGFVVLDVRAAYHPVESRWTQMELSLRRAQLRKQGPRGGP